MIATNWDDINNKIRRANEIREKAEAAADQHCEYLEKAEEAVGRHRALMADLRVLNAEINKDIEIYRGYRQAEATDDPA